MNSSEFQQRRIQQLERQVENQQRIMANYRWAFEQGYQPRKRYARRKAQSVLDPFVWLEVLIVKGLEGLEWLAEQFVSATVEPFINALIAKMQTRRQKAPQR